MINTCKKQFSLKQLSLVHDKPVIFVISQWQRELKPNIFYLIYRWLFALFFFITFIISIVDPQNLNQPASYRVKWLIYLTDWGFTMCTLQALVAAILLTFCTLSIYLKKFANLQDKALVFYKIYWVTNVIATDIAFGITTIYWSVIYNESMGLGAMNLLVHASNSIFMLIDIFVVKHPVRLLHCCYPILFGLCYGIFTAIYYAAGGTAKDGNVYIYSILDWRNPGKTLLICVAVVGFLIILHCLTWSFYKLRTLLHSFVVNTKEHQDEIISEKETAKMSYVNVAMVGNETI